MEITLIAGLAILFITLVIFIYLDIRNDRVYVFSKHIIISKYCKTMGLVLSSKQK